MNRRQFLSQASLATAPLFLGCQGSLSPEPRPTWQGSPHFSLPTSCKQLIVGLAENWDSSSLTVTRFEKDSTNNWRAVGRSIPARLGPGGLAWGNGIHPVPPQSLVKQEGDGKTPAGVFPLGKVYGYAPSATIPPSQTYIQLQQGDLWISDPHDPYYNEFIRLGRPPHTAWEHRGAMRLNDPAHALKLFIGHNSGNTKRAGAGSAIFFHIWREGGKKATAGCTAMALTNLRQLVAWVSPQQNPLYVLLPRSVYQQNRIQWQLP